MILQVSSQETRPAVEPAAGPSLDEVPSPSAVDGESVAPEFEILLGGTAWERMAGETLVLRYSFMAAAPSYANSHERATFSAMDATEREAVRAALDSYAALIDVRFEEVADSDGTDLRFGRSDQRSAAHAYLPGDPGEPARPGEGGAAGDVWLGEDWATLAGAASPDAFLRFVLLHEIGHALGLEHPSVEGASQDDTVMSYTPGQEAGSRLPDSPMSLDIAALRALYGAHEHAGADPSVPAGADGDPLPF
jgi:serralysin